MGISHSYDKFAASHLLTGLEAPGGFAGTHPVPRDPRAGPLATAFSDNVNDSPLNGEKGDLPVEILKAMEDGQALAEAVLKRVRHRFAKLVLMKPDEIPIEKPLAE